MTLHDTTTVGDTVALDDTVDAFCVHGRGARALRDDGPLAGLTFGLKDLYDLDGAPTGAGSPDWLATHAVPTRTAPAAQRLLEAGAVLLGKTHTDEMAWSIAGENAHYGTPVNVAAPGRIPGGSSSGSAAATAAGLVDFAVGSDTGGSVRMPASLCGLYGMRPTHGRIPIDGAVPLAPSYDTVGWFARDAKTFARVGRVLLSETRPLPRPTRLLIADDLFAGADAAVRAALADGLARVAALIGAPEPVTVAGGALAEWRNAFRVIQSSEAWATHGDWATRTAPNFGPGVRERFAAAATLDPREIADAVALRLRIRARMDELVGSGVVLAAPSSPTIAPLRGAPGPEMDDFRARALAMLCPAGHAGQPQVSLPLGTVDGCPVGLALIAARDQDEVLLDLAEALAAA